MITRLGMAPRCSGLTTEAVIEHWRRTHADAAAQIPGLRRYVQLHPVLIDGVHTLGYPGFDAISELDFDSLDALQAGFGSSVYQRTVRDDEARFIDRSRHSMVIAQRHDLSDGPLPSSPLARLLLLVRRHPATSPEQLWDAVTGPYADQVRTVTRYHQVLRGVDVPGEGRHVNAYDLVDELLFEDRQQASRWLASEAATSASLQLAGLIAGATRYLAVEHVVLDGSAVTTGHDDTGTT